MMTVTQQFPTETERKAFVDKVARFRETLAPEEQRMLDAMVVAAFGAEAGGAPAEADVQGYHWEPTPFGWVYTVPRWYQTGWVLAWQYTPWGAVYQPVPTGFWVP